MNVLVYHVRTFTVVQGRGVVEVDTTHVNKIGPFFFGTMILGCANIVRWTLRARAEQKERRPKKKRSRQACQISDDGAQLILFLLPDGTRDGSEGTSLMQMHPYLEILSF